MPKENRRFAFLQVSDSFLDARLTARTLDMNVRQRYERNIEALESVVSLCETARMRNADAVVIGGNLFDGHSITAVTLSKVVDGFASLGDIPVYICCGPSDALTPQSLYRSKVLAAHAVRPWSKNVHIFNGVEFQMAVHPRRSDVTFIGRSCLESRADSSLLQSAKETYAQPPLAKVTAVLPSPEVLGTGALRILVDPSGQELDWAGLARLHTEHKVHYVACCGSRNFKALSHEDGTVYGASCGTLIARNLEEYGSRNALWIELEPTSVDWPAYGVTIEPIISDRRRIVPVTVSVNGIRAQNLPKHVRKTTEATGAEKGTDIIQLKLTGMYPAGVKPDFGIKQLMSDYFHVIVEDGTRPDYMLDKIDPRTVEGRFIHLLREMKKKAESKNGHPGNDSNGQLTPKIIEDALYYGMDALNQKRVTLPDVD